MMKSFFVLVNHQIYFKQQEPMGSSRGLEDFLELFIDIKSYLEPFRAIWSHLETLYAIWRHLEPFATICNHL